MFLKNYDMIKTYSVTHTLVERSFNEDNEIQFRLFNGRYSWRTEQDAWNYFQFLLWSSGFYKDKPTDTLDGSRFFLWPGGTCEADKHLPTPYVSENHIKYDDFNLYRPFYGGNASGSVEDEIYGQNPVVSEAKYNEKTDTWTKTVTREFKNVSGYTIIVKELGVFTEDFLIARELLNEPIIVENDGYFKMSFTYECENPHESRQEKRNRLVKYPVFGGVSYNNSLEFTPTQGDKILLSFSIPFYNEVDEKINKTELTSSGWQVTPLYSYIKKNKPNDLNDKYKTLFRVCYLTKIEGQENYSIKIPNGNTNDYSKAYYYQCLDDLIIGFELVTENDFFSEDAQTIQVMKTAEEKNIIWVLSSTNIQQHLNFPSFYTLPEDQEYCDSQYFYGYYQTFSYFTEAKAGATTHTFGDYREIPDLYISALKLKPIISVDSSGRIPPLWEDIPEQR